MSNQKAVGKKRSRESEVEEVQGSDKKKPKIDHTDVRTIPYLEYLIEGNVETAGSNEEILALVRAELARHETKMEEMLAENRVQFQRKGEEIDKTAKKVMKALKMALEFSASSEKASNHGNGNEDSTPTKEKKVRKPSKSDEEAGSAEKADHMEVDDDNENDHADGSEDMDPSDEEGAPPKKPLTDDELLEQRNPQGKTRLFIKDLHSAVNEDKLRSTFAKCGTVKKIYFVKDRESNKFYGTAFLEMGTPLAAAKALGLKGVKLMGRPLRIRLAKDEKKKGRGTIALPSEVEKQKPMSIFVGNLPDGLDQKVFKKDFKAFGEIISLRFVKDKVSGEFKRCAFVGYKNKASAEEALRMNGQIWMGKALNIELAKS